MKRNHAHDTSQRQVKQKLNAGGKTNESVLKVAALSVFIIIMRMKISKLERCK